MTGDWQGFCETTMTPRYEQTRCECPTYPGNLGPCRTWEQGGNGRCVYCDHEEICHLRLTGMTHGEPNAENVPPSLELVSDVCKCGAFRNQHEHGSGDAKKRAGACDKFVFDHRCSSDELERWVRTIVL